MYDISKNSVDISQNKADISKNSVDISQNKADISKNVLRISLNRLDIDDISLNKHFIQQLQSVDYSILLANAPSQIPTPAIQKGYNAVIVNNDGINIITQIHTHTLMYMYTHTHTHTFQSLKTGGPRPR
jgi:hypothetical protein